MTGERIEISPDVLDPFGQAPAVDALARREKVVLIRPGADSGIELWRVQSSSRKWTVHHETYAFCAVDHYESSPKQSWWYRRRDYSMGPESVMLLEPGELHVTKVLPVADFRVLLVAPWLVGKLLGPFSGNKNAHFRVGQHDDAALVDLFRALCHMIEPSSVAPPMEAEPGVSAVPAGAAPDPLYFEQKLVAFLVRVLKAASDAPCPTPRYCRKSVQLARSFILEHFQRKLSLVELAALGAQSPWHFARSFCAEVGVPPGKYVKRVRIGKALEYLRAGTRSHHVAAMVGFCDQAHMTRAFRQELGITPAYFHRARGASDRFSSE